ncbi:MAG: selenocysteine-specific translation elongation factor [Abitibacteriaceae bacterium]|nr:selenocysteine-specific translation elongation factor [Abditibacteriaceae bacterium]
MHFIIGTAGHVDHGKTTLIRALTGIETDRLQEEKERGLSIVPGFAHLTLPDGRVVGIVDVPGHERFLKNMLSGVTGVDVAMLIIAADEGVMPQTVEHLHILELLKIRGVVVLTKCDLVDADWLMLAREDVRARLNDSLFSTAPLVEVSATSGAGLAELKHQLALACTAIEQEAASKRTEETASSFILYPSSLPSRPFRMAIDRAFTVSGFGTVVTGSATEGEVAVGDPLEVWRQGAAQPLTARIRGIEVHGEAATSAARGQRTALNLAGLDLEEAARGGTIATPGTLHATQLFDAWLEVLPNTPRPVKDAAPLRLHLGTAEVTARVQLYAGGRLEAGQTGYARLRLEAALACARGDRFILREVATERIVGGGSILEAENKLARSTAQQELPLLHEAVAAGNDVALAKLLLRRQCGGMSEAQLRFELCRLDISDVLEDLRRRNLLWSGGGSFLHAATVTQLQQKILTMLRDFHVQEPLQAAMPHETLRAALPKTLSLAALDALLSEMVAAQQIAVTPAGVRLAGHQVTLSEEDSRLKERILSLSYAAAWQPPTIDELVAQLDKPQTARKLCFALIQDGSLVRVGDFVLSAQRVREGADILRQHILAQGSLSIGEARELLGTTRKWVVPLLEFYDRNGLTKRVGESRVLR